MRKRNQNFPNLFPQNEAILEEFWMQTIGGHYKAAVEKNGLQNLQCLEDLMKYWHGERPMRGRSWEGIEFLYISLNIENSHWVAMVMDLCEWFLHIFDLDLSVIAKKKMKLMVEPFLVMLPKILKQSRMFDHLLKAKEEEPLLYHREPGKMPKKQTL
ncbi:hypothetical protein UlMin_013416 [Ulmus minor]